MSIRQALRPPARKGAPRGSPRAPSAARAAVQISEQNGLRLMHLGDDAIQSRMRLDRPDQLSLAYTRAMMGGLLFAPQARDFLMIGLGGGNRFQFLAKGLEGGQSHELQFGRRRLADHRAARAQPSCRSRRQS